MHIDALFAVLNTPEENRLKNMDDSLAAFPYVNGKLFEERLSLASFDSEMRRILLECCSLDWGGISPAIFGSLFQSVMDEKARRNLGAHYTSEKNILKLITPLFLDELWKEFETLKNKVRANNYLPLQKFHKKLSRLKFLDPACGCGNFLVITYRELRLLELEILRELNKTGQGFLDVSDIIWLDVDMMYGIEYEEFPAQIAQVAMWLIDHQMNMAVSAEFGQYFRRLPLKKAATIVHGNALTMDWQRLLNPVNTYDIEAEHVNIYMLEEPDVPYGTVNVKAKSHTILTTADIPEKPEPIKFDYLLGNPPFVGSKLMTIIQRNEVVAAFENMHGSGVLDYVTAWYAKAAKYIQGTKTKVAFVSTNSIVQGEQTAILWRYLMNKYNIKIHFAHRTFKWSNEAKGNAAVYCVIIGFANFDTNNKTIYDYEDIRGEAHEVKAKNINPYLVDARDVLILSRSKPICNVSIMRFGNQPIDGGFLLLNEEERELAIKAEPFIDKYIRQYVGSREFINNEKRYCLWLKNALPEEVRKSEFILKRLQQVKDFRQHTSLKGKNILPSQFALESHQESEYIIVPSVSSERRQYIPMGFMPANVIASNLCLIIPNATLYEFGILTSKIHITWVKNVCGRLKSDYRYSATIVYNNYPFPKNPTEKQKQTVEKAAQKVLDIRKQFQFPSFGGVRGGCSLADLYDPLSMPKELAKAHSELDKAVDLAYRSQPFTSEADRMEFLFELYESFTAGLFGEGRKERNK
jgi:hypothetical protein